MQNLAIFVLLGLVLMMVLCNGNNEAFSTSGLAISDRYCNKLSDVYFNPQMKDPGCRANYKNRICGKHRRSTIDNRTGNYFYDYGVLV
jgi:hypothetical protein